MERDRVKKERNVQEWQPDCLDKCLGCWKHSPKTVAVTGYYMLRILYAVITVHSAVIFAGVITFAALKVTHCLNAGGSDSSSCVAQSESNDDSKQCTKLWGLIKPDSLLTVIGTASAIIVAFSAAITGTALDVTRYRKQIGLLGNVLIIIGMCLCLSLVETSETTLIISSVGLFLVLIFKDYVSLQLDAYGPELSKIPAEVGTAVSGGFCWTLICNVGLIIIWTLIGVGGDLSNSTFGFVVTIGSVILMIICSIITYRRLPHVPAASKLPPGMGIARYTVVRFVKLCKETYSDHTDLGIVLVSGMIFDPALTALFAAAVLIMISKYHFTSDQTTIILGIAILAAIPSVPLSRWLASTHTLSWLFKDSGEKIAEPSEESLKVGPDVECGAASLEMTAPATEPTSGNYVAVPNSSKTEAGTTTERDTEAGFGTQRMQINSNTDALESAQRDPDAVESSAPEQVAESAEKEIKVPSFHPHRVRVFLQLGLILVAINTVLAINISAIACNLGLACLIGATWGFLMSFCWNCFGMLRVALVPGGREAEYSGLYLAMFSCMIWLPLFVFSLANEVWNIDGALYVLLIFFIIGALVLIFVDIERGLLARYKTLSMRRWAHVLIAQQSASFQKIEASDESTRSTAQESKISEVTMSAPELGV